MKLNTSTFLVPVAWEILLTVSINAQVFQKIDLATVIIFFIFFQIWQGTVCSLLELSVVHIILVTIPNNTTVISYGVPILSLLIGISRDRFFQFLNKLYFVIVLLITSLTDKKQRRRSTIPIFVLSILFFPVILGVLGVATVMSAPLLTLFTLPLFFIGFPRPNKFWPEAVGASANSNADSMFYMQVAPKLSQTLRKAFADGSLGKVFICWHCMSLACNMGYTYLYF